MSFDPNIGVLPTNSPFAWNANRDALNVGKNFSTLGSYWTEQMSDDNKSQKFLDSYSPNDITYVTDTTGNHIYKCVITRSDKMISLVEVTNDVSLDFTPANIVSDSSGKEFYQIQIDSDNKTVTLYSVGTDKPDNVDPNNFVYDKEGNICWKLVVNNEDKSGLYFKVEFKGRPKTGGRTHAKILSNISLRTNGLSKLGNANNNLLNDPYNLYITNGSYRFKESYVRQQHSNTNANSYVISFVNPKETVTLYSGYIKSTGFAYNPNFTKELTLKDSEVSGDNYTYVYFSQGIELLKIYTDPTIESGLKAETLLPGFDFLQFKNCIVFPRKVNPYTLFKDNIIYFDGRYLNTSEKAESLYKGICNLEHIPCGLPAQLSANYINGSTQSVKDFELMLNSLVGTPILTEGPAKLIYIKDAQDSRSNVYYLDISSKRFNGNGLVCFGDWSNLSTNSQTNTCYVFKNIINGKSFVVKSQIANEWIDKLTLNQIVPQNHIFNSPIKLISNLEADEVKNVLRPGPIHNKILKKSVTYRAPIFNVNTLFPSTVTDNVSKKYMDNTTSGDIASLVDYTNSKSYWSVNICPLYAGSEFMAREFQSYLLKKFTGSRHSEGEIIVGCAIPGALYICLSLPVLEDLYNSQVIESEYFFNKFPTFKTFIYFIVKIIKRFHPLSYVPITLVSGTTKEVKFQNAEVDSTYNMLTPLTDIDTYDNIDDLNECPFNKGKYADYTINNLPEILK